VGHEWNGHDESEVNASVDQIWDAIATGPGIDSWFVGHTEIQSSLGGSMTTTMATDVMKSTVTAWEPLRRFAFRGDEDGTGRFVAYEFLIEGRGQGSAVVHLVTSGFLPGDDWEAEFDAMTKGNQVFFQTLVAYLNHFAGRTGVSVAVSGPPVTDWTAAWSTLTTALQLSDRPAIGERATIDLGGESISAVVDFLNTYALGLRSSDALYRFVQGFNGGMTTDHHLFAPDDQRRASDVWLAWLTEVYS